MKNLVIGGSGFIGKTFVEFLKQKGEEVINFDIKNSEDQDARIASIDLSNVDRIFFLAWDVGGAKYLYKEDLQIAQLEWNLKLMTNLFPQINKSKKPFLFISSQLAEEYDTVYGVTKRLGEIWTKLLDGSFVRQWNVYGPIEIESIRSHVVSDFVSQAINTGEIRMMTTGEEKRQFIHIDDVCEAWYTAIEQRVKGVHDVTSFEWVKIIDLANTVSNITGAKVIRGDIIGSTPMTPMSGKIPNWTPKINLETGLKKMIEDMKKRLQ